jgi:hypothetical protein
MVNVLGFTGSQDVDKKNTSNNQPNLERMSPPPPRPTTYLNAQLATAPAPETSGLDALHDNGLSSS